MKTSFKIVACMVFLIALLTVSCGSPQSFETAFVDGPVVNGNQLIGVWETVEATFTGPEARTVIHSQPIICIFTKNYMSQVGVLSENPRPELPENATDAQKVAAWEPLSARVSTYEVNGSTITVRHIVDKNPNMESGAAILGYKFEGDTLLLTVKEFPDGSLENPYTIKFTRLE